MIYHIRGSALTHLAARTLFPTRVRERTIAQPHSAESMPHPSYVFPAETGIHFCVGNDLRQCGRIFAGSIGPLSTNEA